VDERVLPKKVKFTTTKKQKAPHVASSGCLELGKTRRKKVSKATPHKAQAIVVQKKSGGSESSEKARGRAR